jgi:quercetin dioxygenase-like cupin family protein
MRRLLQTALAASLLPIGAARAGAQGGVGVRRGPPPSEEQRVALAIERALRKHGPDVHRCFEKSLADRLDVAGKVDLEVDVGPAGQVTKATLVGQGADVPPALATCVQSSAMLWSIEGVEAGASVVLPFAFEGQMSQFVVKAADVPDRGPPAPKSGPQKGEAPFTVKVLADPVNVRAPQAALTLLTIGSASRVAMHRHPRSAKVLYLMKGHARILGPAGVAPLKLEEGTALFLPPGYPHVIENMGRQGTAVFLQIFTPPGPERVYRDPKDPAGRGDFEVIRDPAQAKAPAGPGPTLIEVDKSPALKLPGGKGTARILLDEKATGSTALAVSLLEFAAGAEVARHAHAGASELLYVVSGGGDLTVGSDKMPFGPETALYIPADQPHMAKIGAEPTVAVQIYAPGGPEQRFRGATPPAAVPSTPSK